ncbi:GNAT family N-acetyltransferase [Lysinibacillus sp. FSL L8-0312]|uniref:GNAT family N-acetyltransferase n=1 Tax=Lysinibacillus sp. FSL L8-0312 TaxID=2921521 RepID=UPI004046E5AA
MLTFIIRQMLENDITFVQEIARTSWHHTYEGIIPRDIQDRFLQMAYSSNRLTQRLTTILFLVVIVDESLVGFANFSNVTHVEAKLLAIYLHPDSQGSGIGSALLQRGLNMLPSLSSLFVCVAKENTIGMHFYQAKGFEKLVEFDECFDGYPLKTVKMVKQHEKG